MKKTGDDVDLYVSKVTPAARRRDAVAMVALMREITGRDPELWTGGIIGFGTCHYRYPTGTEGDSPVIGFAPRKTASTIYLLDGIDAHRPDLADLGPHTTGVGCLYVQDLGRVDLEVLQRIVAESHRHVRAGGGDYAELTILD